MAKTSYAAVREQYMLKSSFMYNRLKAAGVFTLAAEVRILAAKMGGGLNWRNHAAWGISGAAWGTVKANGIEPMLVFLHPDVLQAEPRLLRYYRLAAMLPRKGMLAVARVSSLDKIESGAVNGRDLTSQQIGSIVSAVNETMSFVLSMAPDMDESDIQGMVFATAGTGVDGSWRNAIGVEGERVIRTIILGECMNQGDIVSVVDVDEVTLPIQGFTAATLIDSVPRIRAANLRNGSRMVFRSEPDITLYDAASHIVGAVEIKAGLDPAGALERLGGMLKSFGELLLEYPNAVTVFVASCITQEVEARLGSGNVVKRRFLTADITSSDSSKRKFANEIRSILGLI